jgi:4-carboxymuconolactone decarboxylase
MAQQQLGDAGRDGPLDEKTARLVKLGIAIGCMREGAVNSAARKAIAASANRESIEQILTLAASTLGEHRVITEHEPVQQTGPE